MTDTPLRPDAEVSVRELERHIARLVRLLVRARHRAVEDAVDAVSDHLASDDRSESLMVDAILDGIRFGHRAAVAVELGGGMMVRVIEQGGVRLTHEWGLPPGDAERQAIVRGIMTVITGEDRRGERIGQLNADRSELLARVHTAVEAVRRAFGPPGDYGYGTREGDSLRQLYDLRPAISQHATAMPDPKAERGGPA